MQKTTYRMKKMAFCLLPFIVVLVACGPVREQEFSLDRQAYSFQPQSSMDLETILRSATPINYSAATSQTTPRFPPVSWSQKEYVDLLSTLADDEIKLGAKPLTISWAVPCDEVNFGPQVFEITFYRIGIAQGRSMRIETTVVAAPQEGTIQKRKSGYAPPQELYQESDWDSTVPAETLLASAENAGGKEFRASMLNDCFVNGTFGELTYDSSDGKKALSFIFNTKTGELREVKAFPSPTQLP